MRAVAGMAAGAAMAMAAAAAMAALPKQPVGLPNGTYNCIAGNPDMMLTLGQITLSSGRYVFRVQQGRGPTTSGSYTEAGDYTMTFSGGFGVIRHADIVAPYQQPYVVNAFAFHLNVPGASHQTPVSCKKMQG